MAQFEVLIVGIGNILWADEGFGVRAVEAYHRRYADDPRVRVIDGGTLGAYLINEVMQAKRLIIFDCCDLKAMPGTLKVLRNEDIRLWASTKISAHQAGMNDVLASAFLCGYEPQAVTVIGVQPLELNDYGGGLTELVNQQLDPAVEAAGVEMVMWGFAPKEREIADKVEFLADKTLEKDVYEQGRPSEREAFRHGDIRFLK